MIFQRSILREKIALTGVIFFTLFTILTVFFLVRALNDVNKGTIALDVLLKYLLVVSLGFFPIIMVATVMIALIVVISRLYKDSEMVVWLTSGASQWAIFRPVGLLVLPMFAFLLFMNAYLVPWTNQKMESFQAKTAISQLSLIKSGSFQSNKSGERTVFVGEVIPGVLPEFGQIFVSQKNDEQTMIVTAEAARVQNQPDGRGFLVLNQGRQYLTQNKSSKSDEINQNVTSSMVFGQYGIAADQLGGVDTQKLKEPSVDEMSMRALQAKNTSEAWAEWYRRISDAFMIIPMAIFSVVLGYVKPRSTKSWGIILGVLIFMIYVNVIKIGEGAIIRNQLNVATAFALVHGGALIASFFALQRRFNSWRQTSSMWSRLTVWRART